MKALRNPVVITRECLAYLQHEMRPEFLEKPEAREYSRVNFLASSSAHAQQSPLDVPDQIT
jgi:hypothetical protein